MQSGHDRSRDEVGDGGGKDGGCIRDRVLLERGLRCESEEVVNGQY